MSDLLLAWLNHDLRLSTVVTDVERDFASGFLLGELLFRLNHQPNFADFAAGAGADAKIINFCLLEPSLRSMGVRFDASTAAAIMNGVEGAAASLLYQIKMAASRIGRAPPVSTRSLERRSVLPLPNMPAKLAKPAYDAENHAFFELSVRRHVKSLATLKRAEEEVEEETRKKEAYLRKQAEAKEQLELAKAERLHRAFLHSHFIKEALDETDSPAWRVALQKKNEREQRKAAFYQQLLAHRAKQKEEHTFSLRQTVKDDLEEFESRRRPRASAREGVLPFQKSTGYGLRSLSATLEKAESSNNGSLISPASRQTSERLGNRAEVANDSSAIKEQKQRREKRKEQRGRRRKRFVQECEQYHSNLASVRANLALEALVARETTSEKRVRDDIANVIVYKDIARENREMRNAEYAEQQRVDAEVAIDRDASSYGKLVLRYDDDTEVQILQQQQLDTATRAATRHEHELIARGAMQELVEFALFVAGKREEMLYAHSPMVFLPEATWTEYKVQFANGTKLVYGIDDMEIAMLKSDASTDSNNQQHHSQQQQQQQQQEQLLSRHQLDQYLAAFLPFERETDYVGSTTKRGTALSPWCPHDSKFVGAVRILDERYALGEEVKYVRWISAITGTEALSSNPSAVSIVSDADQRESAVPHLEAALSTVDTSVGAESEVEGDKNPSLVAHQNELLDEQPATPASDRNSQLSPASPKFLRVLVFGSPFAGKKTLAQRLAERYDLELISAHQLLDEVIHSDSSSSSSDSSNIGDEARQLLSSGGEVTPLIYSRIVLNAVHALERRVTTSATIDDRQERAEPDQPHRRVKGWIVIDLPGTKEQARSFEELLSGFVDPERIPSPFDHESAIAPGCAKTALPPTFLQGKSGVDLVFSLTSTCESAIERCLGQLEDDATHAKFHLVYNAPPSESTERHRLAHANVSSLTSSELLSLQCVLSADFARAQRPWYEAFATLREVDTTLVDAEEVHARMAACVDEYYRQKEDAVLAARQEEEAAELDRMITEEHQQRRVLGFELAISSAREEHARRQQALQQAEEAKAKKEELTEHRQALDAMQKRVDAAIASAKEAARIDKRRSELASQVFSARLTPPLCSLLSRVWDAMENEYVSVMLQTFDLQRDQRRRTAQRAALVIDNFCAFVRRSDTKQTLVNQFQQRFNEVLDEMRFDDATKCELHARTDLLQDELVLLADSKTAENEEELEGWLSDGWLEDACQRIAVVFQAALQAESDRFLVSFQLLVDGYAAASDTPEVLAPALEHLKLHPSARDVSCRVFFDPTAVVDDTPPAPSAPASTTTGKSAKGKGKATASASATAAAAAAAASAAKDSDPTKESQDDPMTADDLLAAYDRALQKCEAIVQLVTSKVSIDDDVNATSSDTTATTNDAQPASFTAPDTSVHNLLRGIRYEHGLVERRIRFLRDAAQSACEHTTNAMRAVESTLRAVIRERRDREQAAVAALVQFVRGAIEAEVDLPHFINAKPEVLYRFPPTVQLREDVVIDVDPLTRLIPAAPEDPPPVVEQVHRVLLNARQRQELSELLVQEASSMPHSDGERVAIPITTLVDVLASSFADACGLVDVRAFVQATGADETLLLLALESQLRDAETHTAA